MELAEEEKLPEPEIPWICGFPVAAVQNAGAAPLVDTGLWYRKKRVRIPSATLESKGFRIASFVARRSPRSGLFLVCGLFLVSARSLSESGGPAALS